MAKSKDKPAAEPPFTGAWVHAELDDEGNLAVTVHAAAEWRDGETVHYADDVSDSLPDEFRNALTSSLERVLGSLADQSMANARRMATQHAAAVEGRDQPGVTRLKFEGAAEGRGREVR